MKNILYQESIVEIKHLFRMMRNTLLALFVFAGTAFATESYSQTMKVTVVADNMSTGKVISEIEKQTDYLFVYNVNEVNLKRNVKVNAQNKSVAEVLNKVFEGTDIYYAMEGKNIMLMSKAKDGEVAQQANKVTGIVKDTNGEPIIGANVTVKGQSIGTITDIDGRFVLDAPKDAVLQITYIGYVSQEVKVSGNKELNVVLKEDTETLDEVVVVGFGTQKKVNLTGAVGLATAKELESRPVTSATQALQGLVPGLQISTSTGELDKTADISIRGTGTIGEGSSGAPLILIDGMEGDLNTVNPQDIENISVLKDAAASSIYGSRAPFGVILVTTKSGKKGKTSVNYNNSFRISTPVNMPKMMDSYTFANFMNAGSLNQGGGLIFTEDLMQDMLDWQAAGGGSTGGVKASSNGQWGKPDYDPFTTAWANTNWYDEVYKSSSFSQEHNVSLNGGSDIVAYYASFNYLDQGGLLKAGDDGLHRYNVTAKINADLTQWLKFNYSTRFTRNDVWRPTSFNSSFYDQLGRATWPNMPVKDPNGYYTNNGWTNPVQNLVEGGKRNAQTDRLYQQASLVIEPIKNWITHVEFNYSIMNSSVKETSIPTYNHDVEGNLIDTHGTSYLYQDQTKENYLNLNIYSEYSQSFNNAHNAKVMLGFQTEDMKQEFSSTETDVIVFLYDIFLSFRETAESKEMEFKFIPSVSSYPMFVDKGKLDKIVYNLLSNAFKYTPEGGKIVCSVDVEEETKKLIISVSDTGIGIPLEKRGQLFSRFMQSSFSGDSMGIGLHLTHELVNVHKGSIEYAENEGQGSVFTVTLPLDSSVYESKDFLISTALMEETDHTDEGIPCRLVKEEQMAAPLNKKKILIIEDDTDIREFLKKEISVYFEVVAEADGVAGFERARTYDADLIICDVLMPGMNGYEVTRKLKNEFSTSHIPIILLTAMGTTENKLEGVESGADAYVTKPFSLKLLLARMVQLIDQREKLREKYVNDPSIERPAIYTSDKDKQFLDKLQAIIEQELGNSEFTMEDFAARMKLGRTVFSKKVRGLTGHTPNEYFRIIRLKKAAELLLEGNYNVSEVSYKVGISDPLYFSRCFKTHYGVSPSVYLRGKEKEI